MGRIDMDLRQLRHVLALAETRNYLRAAETLHISQSALSRSIQTLEATLGVTLFDRSNRRVEPTEFGHLLIERARALDLNMRDLDRDLAMARGLETGELRIGAGPYGGAMLAATAVGRLCARHPNLRITVVSGPWDEFPERLRAREIDLMVAEMRTIRGKDEFELTEFAPHPSAVVCRPGHPLLSQANPAIVDAFRYPLVGPRMPVDDVEAMLQFAPEAARGELRRRGYLAVTCDSLPVLKTVLQHSDALCIMNLFMVADELRAGTLALLPPHFAYEGSGKFGVAWLRGRTLSQSARAFVNLLLEHDAELLAVERTLAEAC
jgi:DNA-binding transcriptional LysR family regulator